MPRAHRLLFATAAASVLLDASSAAAAPFDPGLAVEGFGAQPALAGLSDAAVGADGTSLVAGTRSSGSGRQVAVAEGRVGQPPVRTELLGPAGDITVQPRVALDDEGHGAIVFGRGSTLYLAVCEEDSCARPVPVGSSALKPEGDVAVQPGTGRVTVLFRGRSRSGINRLQWRVTTGARLGPLHTLGEFGNTPRLGTDASGKTVALWTRYGSAQGLRTAARRVGEFTAPSTLQEGRVGAPQLVTGADGESIAAWVAGASTSGRARIAVRTTHTAFSAPANVGTRSTATLALDRAPDGHAVLALQAPGSIVQQALRAPGGAFSAPVDLSAPAFVSTAAGVSAAIDDAGVPTVAWRSDAGVFAARAGTVQQLSADTSALGQPVVLGAGAGLTSASWVSTAGPLTAQAR